MVFDAASQSIWAPQHGITGDGGRDVIKKREQIEAIKWKRSLHSHQSTLIECMHIRGFCCAKNEWEIGSRLNGSKMFDALSEKIEVEYSTDEYWMWIIQFTHFFENLLQLSFVHILLLVSKLYVYEDCCRKISVNEQCSGKLWNQ